MRLAAYGGVFILGGRCAATRSPHQV
jgi:hypothetical protein